MTMGGTFPAGQTSVTINYKATSETLYVPVPAGSEYRFSDMAQLDVAPSSIIYPKPPGVTGYVKYHNGSMLLGNAGLMVAVMSTEGGMEGITVSVDGAEDYTMTTLSDGLATGGIPPGPYSVSISGLGEHYIQPSAQSITCNCNNNYNVTFDVDREGQVTFTIAGSDGAVLSGATIKEGSTVLGTTDASGQAVVWFVAGTHTITVVPTNTIDYDNGSESFTIALNDALTKAMTLTGYIAVTYSSYPNPIPVNAGSKYSTDGTTWTTVTSAGVINASGTFTGYVRYALDGATVTLTDYGGESMEAITSLSVGRNSLISSTDGNGNILFGGGYSNGNYSVVVDKYAPAGVRSTLTDLSVARGGLASSTDGAGNVLIGGGRSNVLYTTVDKYAPDGVKSMATALSVGRDQMASSTDGAGNVLFGGGQDANNSYSVLVEKYTSAGVRSTATSLSVGRQSPAVSTDGNGNVLFGGGNGSGGKSAVVDKYTSAGVRSTLADLSIARAYFMASTDGAGNVLFAGGWGQINGNYYAVLNVDKYAPDGVRSMATDLSVGREYFTASTDGNGNVLFGGGDSGGNDRLATVDKYNSAGVRSTAPSLSVGRNNLASSTDGNGNVLFGGGYGGGYSAVVDRYSPPSAKIPVTAGSRYKFTEDTEQTATESTTLSYNGAVSGYIVYAKGSILYIIVTYTSYTNPIPVNAGTMYSTDGTAWTTCDADGVINENGTFTGYVKYAPNENTVTLTDYGSIELMTAITPLSVARYALVSSTDGVGNVLFGGGSGGGGSGSAVVDRYTSASVRSTLTSLSVGRFYLSASTDGAGNVLFGGGTGPSAVVDKYTPEGVRSTATALSVGRAYLSSSTDGDGNILFGGGYDNNNYLTTVDKYTPAGVRSTATALSVARRQLASSTDGDGSVIFGGGYNGSSYLSTVDKYTSAGVRSTLTDLSVGRNTLVSSTDGDGSVIFGGGGVTGSSYTSAVDKYTSEGVRSTLTDLSVARTNLSSSTDGSGNVLFGGGYVGNSVCTAVVEKYTSAGVRSTAISLSVARYSLTASTDGNGNVLFGGGLAGNPTSAVVDKYSIPSAKIPVTAGSKYRFTEASEQTASTSGTLTYDGTVSGYVTYAQGTI